MQAPRSILSRERTASTMAFYPKPYPMVVGIRPLNAEEMTGLEMYEDGISFRSPHPMDGGKMVEVVLCHGKLVMEAEISHCKPLHDDQGGFVVRARFLNPSQEISNLLCEELAQGEEEMLHATSPKPHRIA